MLPEQSIDGSEQSIDGSAQVLHVPHGA